MRTHRHALALVAGLACLATAGQSAAQTAQTAQAAQDAALAGPPRPANLVVVKATVDHTGVPEGGTLRVAHTVANRGNGKAVASRTRFYLSTDPAASLKDRRSSRADPRTSPLDLLLAGTPPTVASIAPGAKRAVGAARVVVPLGTAPGRYTLLACADDLGTVKESQESDNCTAATQTVVVTALKGTSGLEVWSYADTREWPASEAGNVAFMRQLCSSIIKPRAMGPAAAISSLRAYLTDKAGASALQQVAKSGLADTEVEAQQLAAAAVAQGSPGLALAALLRAHDLEPGNGSHLVNAAGLAVSLGLPNEAIGLLDGASGLHFNKPAMGISMTAIAQVVRGEALVLTGRNAAAVPLFSAARRQAPLLTEADSGLATVEACRNNTGLAGRYLRMARQRIDRVEDPTKPAPPRPEPELDLSQGRVTTLRHVPIADSPAQGVRLDDHYRAIIDDVLPAATDRQNAEDTELTRRLLETEELISDAEHDRRNDLMSAAYTVETPEMRAADQAMDSAYAELVRLREGFFGGGEGNEDWTVQRLSDEADEACATAKDYNACHLQKMKDTCRPALRSAHTEYAGLMDQLQTAAAGHQLSLSKAESAYAANLADVDANRQVLLHIEQVESSLYSSMVFEAEAFTVHEVHYREECVDPADNPSGGDPTVPDAPSAGTAGDCPDLLNKITFVAELGPTKLEISCEKIKSKIDQETGLPLAKLFAEAEYNFRSGKATMLLGAKFGGKIGAGVDVGFKSGMYLKTDGHGGIEDVGMRVGPAVKITPRAGTEVSIYKDEIDMSFVPGLMEGIPGLD